MLSNEQVEEDLKAKGRITENGVAYSGSQDTGDKIVRHLGNDVQRADGRPATPESGE